MDIIDRNRMFILFAVGLAASFLCLLASPFYAILALAAVIFTVFTFFQIEISLCLFLFAACVFPHSMWNNIYILFAAIYYCIICAVLYALGKKQAPRLKYVYPSLIIFVAFSVLSLFTGNDFGDGLRMFMILFSCIIFYVLISSLITDRRKLHTLLVFLLLAVFITALFGLYQSAKGIEIRADFVDLITNNDMPGRVFSNMDNPNNYAEFLTMLGPILLALILTQKSDLKRLLFAVMLAPALIALILTFSRASYIAIVLAAAIFILMVGKRLIPVVIFLAAAAVPFLPSVIVNRILTIGKDSSSALRFKIWESVFRTLKYYWLTGIGIGPASFAKIYKANALVDAVSVMHSHNTLLQIWLETGIGGILAFLAFLLKMLTSVINAFLSVKDRSLKILLAGCASAICVFFAFSLVEHVWFYARVNLTFWIICGIATAAIKISLGENTEKSDITAERQHYEDFTFN
jgi:O-antigen ligase